MTSFIDALSIVFLPWSVGLGKVRNEVSPADDIQMLAICG